MSVAVISTKPKMYRLLSAGALGNTLPVWYSVESWEADPGTAAYRLWGIRSVSKAGDPRMRLNVPAGEVADLYREWYPSGGGSISPMIDRYAVLRAEVFENDFGHPFGLSLFYVPPGLACPADPWRGSFRKSGRHAHGAAAVAIMKAYLWPSDYEDVRALLERYPGHVVEFSACDRAVGVIPHRNTIIWEVRKY